MKKWCTQCTKKSSVCELIRSERWYYIQRKHLCDAILDFQILIAGVLRSRLSLFNLLAWISDENIICIVCFTCCSYLRSEKILERTWIERFRDHPLITKGPKRHGNLKKSFHGFTFYRGGAGASKPFLQNEEKFRRNNEKRIKFLMLLFVRSQRSRIFLLFSFFSHTDGC